MFETEGTEAIREVARSVAKQFDRSYFLDIIRRDERPTAFHQALAEAGLLGVGLAEEHGGFGGGLPEEAALVHELALAGILSPFLIANFCRKLVVGFGSDEQRRQFIPPTLDGKYTTAFGLTEATSGTNAFAMRTKAVLDGDNWVINGQKVYISGAEGSCQMLLVARTSQPSSEARTSGLSLFIVPMPAPGISMTRMNTVATLPEHQSIVFLDDVRVPRDALVGEEGKGIDYIFTALNAERILAAAMFTGVGQYLLNRGVEYARTRAPFGTPIGNYQAIQHKLAKPYIHLDAALTVAQRAAMEFETGKPVGVIANSAKYLAAEAAEMAFDATVQVHGGQAFDHDTDIMTYHDQVRLMKVAPINDEMVLNFVAQKIFGQTKAY